jgi:hypothetical protein
MGMMWTLNRTETPILRTTSKLHNGNNGLNGYLGSQLFPAWLHNVILETTADSWGRFFHTVDHYFQLLHVRTHDGNDRKYNAKRRFNHKSLEA